MRIKFLEQNVVTNLSFLNYCKPISEVESEVCWFLHTDQVDFYLKVIFMGLTVIIGLICNVLLAATILMSHRLRSKSINVFIFNLSFSNILQLLISGKFSMRFNKNYVRCFSKTKSDIEFLMKFIA